MRSDIFAWAQPVDWFQVSQSFYFIANLYEHYTGEYGWVGAFFLYVWLTWNE